MNRETEEYFIKQLSISQNFLDRAFPSLLLLVSQMFFHLLTLEKGRETMRGMLLSTMLMIVAAVMMGCTDSIVPCTVDEDCQIDWSWGDDGAATHGGGDIGLVCNLEVSPLEKCEEMVAHLTELIAMLDLGDWITLPDCAELYGGLPDGTGTCDISMDWL
jgi:hypothetical protein